MPRERGQRAATSALKRALEHAELMPYDQDLQLEGRPALKRGAEGGEKGR